MRFGQIHRPYRPQFDDVGKQGILGDLQAHLRKEVVVVPRHHTTELAQLQIGAPWGLMLFFI
jgi:hypothetical protein